MGFTRFLQMVKLRLPQDTFRAVKLFCIIL